MGLISKIKTVLRNLCIIIWKLKKIRMYKIIIKRYKDNPANFYFIQIGSNDGIRGDPIYNYVVKYNWKGILVEPIPYIFKKLKKNYNAQQNVFFENVAISGENCVRAFYRVEENDEPDNPCWYDQLGSFNKDVVLKSKRHIPNFDKHFIKEKVKCITFSMLLKKYKVQHLDLLHIDTEGYDYEIIKLIPFVHMKPKMILYEHKHLSDKDNKRAVNLLKKQNYEISRMGGNTFAYL